MALVTRFAPSPTGRLHLGHAYSALLAYEYASRADGVFLLRMENIDPVRCRPEFEAGICEDLAWLGISWPVPVRRQACHLADYAAVIERLRGLGVLYRCFLTRREIAEQSMSAPHGAGENGQQVIYNGPSSVMSADEEADRLNRGESFAWRLSLKHSQDLLGEDFARLAFVEVQPGSNTEHRTLAQPQLLGDVILARKDTPVSYHLAVVHDDALQGVTHVIRGEDLRISTHVHVLLQRLLGLPSPVYLHHRLILGPDGRRYAKRDSAMTLAALREAGVSPGDIRARIGLQA